MKYTPVPNDQYTDKMAKRDKRVINKAIKEAMSNSTQNDHETHTACIERIRKEGASSTCCYCDPHEGCTLGMKPTQNDWEHDYVMDIINIVGVMTTATQYGKIDKILTDLLADARKEVIKRIEAMPDKDVRPQITVWLESKEYCLGYNKALSNVLATLREEEKHG